MLVVQCMGCWHDLHHLGFLRVNSHSSFAAAFCKLHKTIQTLVHPAASFFSAMLFDFRRSRSCVMDVPPAKIHGDHAGFELILFQFDAFCLKRFWGQWQRTISVPFLQQRVWCNKKETEKDKGQRTEQLPSVRHTPLALAHRSLPAGQTDWTQVSGHSIVDRRRTNVAPKGL